MVCYCITLFWEQMCEMSAYIMSIKMLETPEVIAVE